jgi:hypothetical protein
VTSWPPAAGAAPAFATPRNLERRTDGAQVAAVARELGTPLIPWQRYVADVAGERRPDGAYEYEIVVVSVPRQTGKTTLMRAVGVHRCLVCGRDVFYTAQTGKDARERWTDLVKLLRVNAAFGPRVKVALRGGSEGVTFFSKPPAEPDAIERGSFRVFAPTPESLHGYTPPTVMVDEAFSLERGAGELLLGAIGPAQITVRDRQIWIVSTAGTAESEFLHGWIDAAMEGTPRVAGFVWAAGDDTDAYAVDGVRSYHPGVGFELNGKVLEPEDVIAQAPRHGRAEYERAYANRRTLTKGHTFPAELLRDLAAPLEPPEDTGAVVLVYDVAHDSSAGVVVAVWRREDGKPAAKVVLSAPGASWLAEAVSDLERRWRPMAVGADDAGASPSREVTAALQDAGTPLELVRGPDYAAACGLATRLLNERGVRLDGLDTLIRG